MTVAFKPNHFMKYYFRLQQINFPVVFSHSTIQFCNITKKLFESSFSIHMEQLLFGFSLSFFYVFFAQSDFYFSFSWQILRQFRATIFIFCIYNHYIAILKMFYTHFTAFISCPKKNNCIIPRKSRNSRNLGIQEFMCNVYLLSYKGTLKSFLI